MDIKLVMSKQLYTPKQFASMIDRSVRTLQKWDVEGSFKAHRNPKNRRYYTHDQYLEYLGIKADSDKKTVVYCRVSSAGQKNDLTSRLSSWLKSSLKERLSFKALVKGFDHQQVNPAYTSQICPDCDFVDASNRCSRNKDKFVCRHCKIEGDSDVFAAINLKARYADSDITRYTPIVKLKRFC